MIVPTIRFSIDVVIPRIIELGMVTMPREACGLVIPDLDKPPDSWVVELENTADNPLTSYKIEGPVICQLALDRNSEGDRVWEDVLVWHTHPSGSPTPSEGDYDARVPGVKYLVVALPSGQATMF